MYQIITENENINFSWGLRDRVIVTVKRHKSYQLKWIKLNEILANLWRAEPLQPQHPKQRRQLDWHHHADVELWEPRHNSRRQSTLTSWWASMLSLASLSAWSCHLAPINRPAFAIQYSAFVWKLAQSWYKTREHFSLLSLLSVSLSLIPPPFSKAL